MRAVLRVLVLFALVTPFWSLFDQKASTWVLQADAMIEAELVPVVADAGAQSGAGDAAHSVQQPGALSRAAPLRLSKLTALRRMTAGIAFSGLSWIVVGAMQVVLDDGNAFSITWQVLPYASAHLRRGAGVRDRTRVRLQPGAARDEGRDHGVLESVGDGRQLWVLVVNAGVKNDGVIDFIKSSGFG